MSLSELHGFIVRDDVANVSRLVEQGADVNAVIKHETAFTRAAEGSRLEVMDIIIKSGSFDPNALNQFSRSPLFMASKNNLVSLVHTLLKLGAEVDAADIRGETPLSIAAWYNNYEVAEFLIKHGAVVNRADKSGLTLLHRAACNASLDVVQVLLRRGADVNAVTPDMRTSLMLSLPTHYNLRVAKKKMNDMLSVCELVIETGCDINKQDAKGRTALHHAVENDSTPAVCLLAERNCLLDLKDESGLTPLQQCLKMNRFNLAAHLLYYGADVTSAMPYLDTHVRPLLYLLFNQSSSDKKLLNSKCRLARLLCEAQIPPIVETPNVIGRGTANEIGGKCSYFEDIYRWLENHSPCSLQHLVKVRLRESLKGTNILPKIRHLPIGNKLKQYLNLGLDLENLELFQLCRLHASIVEFDQDKVEEILETNLNIDFPIDDRTALESATQASNKGAVESILKLRCSKRGERAAASSHTPGDVDTLLHIAAKNGTFPALEDFLVLDDLNQPNPDGFTPLQLAVAHGQFKTAERLVAIGATLSDRVGDLPLMHLAASSGAAEFVELLLSKGMNPNSLDQYGNSPMHVAASKGAVYLKKAARLPALYSHEVLEAVDICAMTVTGRQPLLTRPDANHYGVIECLLRAGADLALTDAQGKTAAQCAEESSATDLLMLLI